MPLEIGPGDAMRRRLAPMLVLSLVVMLGLLASDFVEVAQRARQRR